MRAPYSRIPALPAAIGLAAGIAVAGAGAAVLFSVAAGAVSAVVLWVWRPRRSVSAFCSVLPLTKRLLYVIPMPALRLPKVYMHLR